MVITSALQALWQDAATIRTTAITTDADGISSRTWSALCTDEPCKLSFFTTAKSNSPGAGEYNANALAQSVKLFLRPDLVIPPGSRVTVVTHDNQRTLYFESSGIPAIFTNHQEVSLEAVQKWA